MAADLGGEEVEGEGSEAGHPESDVGGLEELRGEDVDLEGGEDGVAGADRAERKGGRVLVRGAEGCGKGDGNRAETAAGQWGRPERSLGRNGSYPTSWIQMVARASRATGATVTISENCWVKKSMTRPAAVAWVEAARRALAGVMCLETMVRGEAV